MKHTFTGMMIALMLVLALVIGAVALAENAEPEIPETPAVEQTQSEAPSTDTAADSTALQDAFKAYNEARSSSHQEDRLALRRRNDGWPGLPRGVPPPRHRRFSAARDRPGTRLRGAGARRG